MWQQYVEENLGLVHAVARRFVGRGVEYDDLVQIGCVGLVKAAKNFKAELGFRFSTYAVPLIIGELKRYFRDDGAVKVSRALKERAAVVHKATEKLLNELGHAPTLSELALETGLSKEEIAEATDAVRPCVSLYLKHDEEDLYVIDKLCAEDVEEINTDRIFLKDMLNSLDKRSRCVLLLRYFKEETQQQIASRLGISQVQVSRIEKKVLCALRNKFSDTL